MACSIAMGRPYLASVAGVVRTAIAGVIGIFLVAGMFATTATAQISILETFDGGVIHTHNGRSVVWTNGVKPWGPGTATDLPLPLDQFWQGYHPPAWWDSIPSTQTLTVEIGALGGSLSFDWSINLQTSSFASFWVTLDNATILSENDQAYGHKVVALLPGTRTIRFNVAAAAGAALHPDGGAGIDNVAVTGIVVPEPGSFALLGVAALGLLSRRRRGLCIPAAPVPLPV